LFSRSGLPSHNSSSAYHRGESNDDENLKMSDEPKTSNVSVIAFREDSGWTALALEMNLRGYGSTVKEAIDGLVEMLVAQASFALQKGHAESAWNRADDKYWRTFEEGRRNRFVAEVSGLEPPTDLIADMVPLSLLAMQHRAPWIAANS
jgi:hypothetical protein